MQSEYPSVRLDAARFGKPVLWRVTVLAGLSLWLYAPTFARLAAQWWNDSDFSHGPFVPLFSAFVLWQERKRLLAIVPKPSWSGLAVMIFAMGLLIGGQLGAELFTARVSFLFLLAGLIVLFLGWEFFRAVFFPWAFLLLMIPIPSIIFSHITFPLQIEASKLAGAVLPLLGVPVLRQGNVIYTASLALEVAKACSGIRSLMSLITLAIIYGYLMERRQSVRWLLALASVPVAIVANSFRVITTGLMAQYWDPDKAEGIFHAAWGLIVFVISLAMLYGLHSLISKLWPDRVAAA